jgi:hypothetical protein
VGSQVPNGEGQLHIEYTESLNVRTSVYCMTSQGFAPCGISLLHKHINLSSSILWSLLQTVRGFNVGNMDGVICRFKGILLVWIGHYSPDETLRNLILCDHDASPFNSFKCLGTGVFRFIPCYVICSLMNSCKTLTILSFWILPSGNELSSQPGLTSMRDGHLDFLSVCS